MVKSKHRPQSVAITVSGAFIGYALLHWFFTQQLRNALEKARSHAELREAYQGRLLKANTKLRSEIGERRRAEKALRASEVKYSSLFSNRMTPSSFTTRMGPSSISTRRCWICWGITARTC